MEQTVSINLTTKSPHQIGTERDGGSGKEDEREYASKLLSATKKGSAKLKTNTNNST